MNSDDRRLMMAWQAPEIAQQFRDEVATGKRFSKNLEKFRKLPKEDRIIEFLRFQRATYHRAMGQKGVCNHGVLEKIAYYSLKLSVELSPNEMDFIIAYCGIEAPPIPLDSAMNLYDVSEKDFLRLGLLMYEAARGTEGIWKKYDSLPFLD